MARWRRSARWDPDGADITIELMAPLATRMLADRDADVIKIEPLGSDAMRNGRPGQPKVMLSLFRNTPCYSTIGGVRKR